jgi:hypothetical protein
LHIAFCGYQPSGRCKYVKRVRGVFGQYFHGELTGPSAVNFDPGIAICAVRPA